MKKLKLVAVFLFGILLFSSVSVGGINSGDEPDDFYFVHMADTHLLHKIFDRSEKSRDRLVSVLDHISSFDEKPAFVVITGDLVEWGSGVSGRLNYMALMDCFYEKDSQHYADSNHSIPVYFTPGNHDYYFDWNLINYHRLVDSKHVLDDDRYVVTYNDASLFFMDSGRHYMLKPKDWLNVFANGLTDRDIKWLEDSLSSCSSQHKIILMHHPAVFHRDEAGVMNNVILRNREQFIELCDKYDVDLVLNGHTHRALVFDGAETLYNELPLNCSQYPTFYVHSEDNKQGRNYRNISIVGNDVWLEDCEQVNVRFN